MPLGLDVYVKAESGLWWWWRKAKRLPSLSKAMSGSPQWEATRYIPFLFPCEATLGLTRQGLKKGSNWGPVKSILLVTIKSHHSDLH